MLYFIFTVLIKEAAISKQPFMMLPPYILPGTPSSSVRRRITLASPSISASSPIRYRRPPHRYTSNHPFLERFLKKDNPSIIFPTPSPLPPTTIHDPVAFVSHSINARPSVLDAVCSCPHCPSLPPFPLLCSVSTSLLLLLTITNAASAHLTSTTC